MNILNSFEIENELFYYYDLKKVFSIYESLRNLPISLKILLEENLRKATSDEEIEYIIDTFLTRKNSFINFYPSRMITQDFTILPSLIDLASLREKVKDTPEKIDKINPKLTVDLLFDYDLEHYCLSENIKSQIEKNKDKYKFIKWSQTNFSNFRVIPPGSGICHQLNLEYLSTIIHLEQKDGKNYLFPETVLGSNSNSSITNSLGVLSYSVGGIDTQLSLLGYPIKFKLPKVLGVNIKGKLRKGLTSSDLVLYLKFRLKEHGINKQIVEFLGDGLSELTLEDRSYLSNMATKYGAISFYFPIEDKTLLYFTNTKNSNEFSKLIKRYLKNQELFFENKELSFDETIEINLDELEPIIFDYKDIENKVRIKELDNLYITKEGITLKDTSIVLASINTCTMVSNPYLLIHAGLVAKKAYELGLKANENIKKVLIIKSHIVKSYLTKLDLLKYFEYLGFDIIGNECDTIYLLDERIEEEIRKYNLNVVSISSGNRHLKEKIHPLIKSSYLMSPSLLIVYTLGQTIKSNIIKEMKSCEFWPNNDLVIEYLDKLDFKFYKEIYNNIFLGDISWQNIQIFKSKTFDWDENSIDIKQSNFINSVEDENNQIENAAILALLGDNIETKYISPQGQISLYSEAGNYLEQKGIKSFDYNTFESRCGNFEIMSRGMFDNVSLKNKIISKEGGFTKDFEKDEIVSIYELAQRFKQRQRPLVLFAGENFGIGEEIEWSIKGIKELGIRAIIAKSFDKKYKSDLHCLGILALEFTENEDINILALKGDELIDIYLDERIKTNSLYNLIISSNRGIIDTKLNNSIDESNYKNNSNLSSLLNDLIAK
ncbi:aconitate hydratase domain protein [Arcobacter nitrofigilis DSM 7299]|uniref:Aconitate hydratase domain protein n=1 Tax=Arcobacter nitrofigilis (strain ATCC 33309 / DSM 7299 / CCUG 15893 / LMG 7604 / NCTC 12251 / CI) TaxID=572480 RepID=D5V014_ARCNC|nr:aconitate hydratase AcnA [Arcobacter nitrofigilis]ADG93626.1 aconitate hydratase domain protein [Arcobacter nitrofigilis DSM 7299]